MKFVFTILYGKMHILFGNIVKENLIDTITFILQFFGVAGYLKRRNETPIPL